MVWNPKQIDLIKQYLAQYLPKFFEQKCKGMEINESSIEFITRKVQDELRKVFDKRIEIRSLLTMQDRTLTFYLVQEELKSMIEISTGII